MDEKQLLTAFESCELATADFPHREHVRVAWAMLREDPVLVALPRFVSGLQRFANFHGATGLYNETITWLYLILIHERMEAGEPDETWAAFAERNPDLVSWNGGELLNRCYPNGEHRTEFAKRVFVLPGR
jgi:hypothetical protein